MKYLYKYILPDVDWKINVPKNCVKMSIRLIGGGGSASFDGNNIIGGSSGGEVVAKFNSPSVNDDIIVRLGLGGPFQITSDNNVIRPNSGQHSTLTVKGDLIAVAGGSVYGLGGGTDTIENKYCWFKAFHGEDGSGNKRGQTLTNWYEDDGYETMRGNNCYFADSYVQGDAGSLADADGKQGDGGMGKEFSNGARYLGAGGHGYCLVWTETI